MATFQERLNQLYDEAKDKNYRLTQEEFALTFNATRNQLTGWLDGRGEPNTETLKAIAKISGVSVAWLVGDSDIRNQQIDALALHWPDVVNTLNQFGRTPTFDEQLRVAKIIKAAIEDK